MGEALAQEFDISSDLVRTFDKDEFAQGLLNCEYLANRTEEEKATWRKGLRMKLQQRADSLPTMPDGPTEKEILKISQMYIEEDGDIDRLEDAHQLGVDAERFSANPASDARDFAKKYFTGCYVPDVEEVHEGVTYDDLKLAFSKITRRMLRREKTTELHEVPLQLFAHVDRGSITVSCANLAGDTLQTFDGLALQETAS